MCNTESYKDQLDHISPTWRSQSKVVRPFLTLVTIYYHWLTKLRTHDVTSQTSFFNPRNSFLIQFRKAQFRIGLMKLFVGLKKLDVTSWVMMSWCSVLKLQRILTYCYFILSSAPYNTQKGKRSQNASSEAPFLSAETDPFVAIFWLLFVLSGDVF